VYEANREKRCKRSATEMKLTTEIRRYEYGEKVFEQFTSGFHKKEKEEEKEKKRRKKRWKRKKRKRKNRTKRKK